MSEKVRQAGVEGVRILTEDEMQRDQLLWFRSGWEEHGRAMEPERPGPGTRPADRPGDHLGDDGPDGGPDKDPPPDNGPGRLLRFPSGAGQRPTHPLPIVGAGDASVRDLMPHRPRTRTRVRTRDVRARDSDPVTGGVKRMPDTDDQLGPY
ncbi:hypothetical protein [Streptomyces inusitatus]|uniref:hypothetical protein n=1 Tax=Streptomyces inusitatus TaxID=68221 RepID=UPI00167F1AC6|nr:hypothetical protein [Streptomyces inusitatus]